MRVLMSGGVGENIIVHITHETRGSIETVKDYFCLSQLKHETNNYINIWVLVDFGDVLVGLNEDKKISHIYVHF